MSEEIKQDPNNARIHNEDNKAGINKSLKRCGAGRSIVIDNDGFVIGGNGVLEQADELGIKTKIIETTGDELIVVKRTDLSYEDPKRRELAIADNAVGDTSTWDFNEVTEEEMMAWDISFSDDEEFKDELPKDLSDEIETEFKIEISCSGEREQEALYNEMTKKGYKCRVLTL